MALSDWDVCALNEKGEPLAEPIHRSAGGITVEIHKNNVWVRDPRAHREDLGWGHNAVMMISEGQLQYQDVEIIALRGPQNGVYVVVWADIMYSVAWGGSTEMSNSSDVMMHWWIYPIESFDGHIEIPLYWRKGSSGNSDLTPDIDNAKYFVSGFIKWDGCMQFDAIDMHFDTRTHARNFAEAIERIRDLMHAIDKECDGRDDP